MTNSWVGYSNLLCYIVHLVQLFNTVGPRGNAYTEGNCKGIHDNITPDFQVPNSSSHCSCNLDFDSCGGFFKEAKTENREILLFYWQRTRRHAEIRPSFWRGIHSRNNYSLFCSHSGPVSLVHLSRASHPHNPCSPSPVLHHFNPHISASKRNISFRLQAGYLTLYCRLKTSNSLLLGRLVCMSGRVEIQPPKKPLTWFQGADPKFLPHCWNNQQFLKSSVQKGQLICPLENFDAKKTCSGKTANSQVSADEESAGLPP